MGGGGGGGNCLWADPFFPLPFNWHRLTFTSSAYKYTCSSPPPHSSSPPYSSTSSSFSSQHHLLLLLQRQPELRATKRQEEDMASSPAALLLLLLLCISFTSGEASSTLSSSSCFLPHVFPLDSPVSSLSCSRGGGGLLPDGVREAPPAAPPAELHPAGSREGMPNQRRQVRRSNRFPQWGGHRGSRGSQRFGLLSDGSERLSSCFLQVPDEAREDSVRPAPGRRPLGEEVHQVPGGEPEEGPLEAERPPPALPVPRGFWEKRSSFCLLWLKVSEIKFHIIFVTFVSAFSLKTETRRMKQ